MSALARINTAITRLRSSLSKARELELIATMSDAELARHGIRRDQIPAHFFGDNRNG